MDIREFIAGFGNVHKWRLRFALLPTKRIEMCDGFVSDAGWYWFRIVLEVEVGLVPEWTAYAHMNDGLKLNNLKESL